MNKYRSVSESRFQGLAGLTETTLHHRENICNYETLFFLLCEIYVSCASMKENYNNFNCVQCVFPFNIIMSDVQYMLFSYIYYLSCNYSSEKNTCNFSYIKVQCLYL